MNTHPIVQPKHLPYELDPNNRWHAYEALWKKVGLDLLKKHLPPDRRQTVLDYGCGRGETIDLFRKAGYEVMGTDVDPECVRISAQFGTSTLLDPNHPISQFGEKSFDVVTCFHVLEHVDSPKKTLLEITRIARKYVIIAVPNLRRLTNLRVKTFDLKDVNEGHLQSWDHWHLRNLAERYCGLSLVEWGADVTVLPGLSNLVYKFLGRRATIYLETGFFRKVFPYHCASIIGLFRVVQ